MKRMIIRTVSLVLSLLLCAGAAAESVDDLSYTMYEKLQKQLNAGSGFSGTATLSIAAVEGRENDAYSTVKPLALNWQYIKAYGDAGTGTPDAMHLILTLDQNDYQQGSAEFSVQEGELYMRSSLLPDGWYLIGKNVAGTVLDRLGIPDALPDSVQTLRAGGLMPGSASFFRQYGGLSDQRRYGGYLRRDGAIYHQNRLLAGRIPRHRANDQRGGRRLHDGDRIPSASGCR